jgi:hypothetical protein
MCFEKRSYKLQCNYNTLKFKRHISTKLCKIDIIIFDSSTTADTEEPLRYRYQSYTQIPVSPKRNTTPGNILSGTNTRSSFLRVSTGELKLECNLERRNWFVVTPYTTDIISRQNINQIKLKNTFRQTRSVTVNKTVTTGH